MATNVSHTVPNNLAYRFPPRAERLGLNLRRALLALMALLPLSGCVQETLVVRVRPDGGGQIEVTATI